MDRALIYFVAVTSVAVVLQVFILAGMYIATRKATARMEALSTRMEEQVLPLVEKVRGIVDENAPMVKTVVTNVTETSTLLRSQIGRIDGTVTEVVDIVRAQAGRADELATRTMQRIDITAGVWQHSIAAPGRRLSALVDGLRAGIQHLANGRRPQEPKQPANNGTSV